MALKPSMGLRPPRQASLPLGIERPDVEHIMSTFLIVERKDRAACGTYRSRDLILGYYDAYATDRPSALQTWLGPEEKRTTRMHSGEPADQEATDERE